ncbi:MAG: phosphatidylserine decarboxylase [Pseudomonadota bacterium]|nr:phosphatidylserine decarboxylase [Pseudomonadota bacterium]
MKNALDTVLVPIHREGYPFITLCALLGFGIGFLWSPLWFAGILLTAWCVYFFRDPPRVTPTRQGLVISPADGLVQSVSKAEPPPELDMPAKPVWRVCVFMNVFDVHVNRAPVDGTITKMEYRPGKFLNASLDKASSDNERQSFRIEVEGGKELAVVQIAGLVARRILADVETGDDVKAGQRIGMIRFGSRVDVYLPPNVVPMAVEGQRAIAGETVLADMGGPKGKEGPRDGAIR